MIKYTADETNNCLACCIAGMFDLPLGVVPGVHEWGKLGYWFDNFYNWSKEELGHVPIAVVDDTLEDLYYIAVLENSNNVPHAVIAKCMSVVWDPSPNDKITELDDTMYGILFVHVDGLCMQNACHISHMEWIQEQVNKELGINEQGTMG